MLAHGSKPKKCSIEESTANSYTKALRYFSSISQELVDWQTGVSQIRPVVIPVFEARLQMFRPQLKDNGWTTNQYRDIPAKNQRSNW